MITRWLWAIVIVMLGAGVTVPTRLIMHGSSEPISAMCETVRVGAPILTMAAAGFLLLIPFLARWWSARIFSGWRALVAASVLATALPLVSLGLLSTGVLSSGDPFAGKALPLEDAHLSTNVAQPLDLRFQGQVGQVFLTVQTREITSTAAVGGCDASPTSLSQSFRQTVEQTVGRVAANGTLTVRQKWPKVEIWSLRNDEVEFHIDSSTPASDGEEIDLLSVTLDAEQFPDGSMRILAVEGEGPGVERVRSTMEWAETQDASMLPDVPVKPGDKWNLGQRRLVLPDGGTLTYTPEATFAGVTTQNGRQLAVINIAARDVAYAADVDRNLSTQVERFAVKGRIIWDVAAGRPLSDSTLVDFVGRSSAAGHSDVLLRVQANLQSIENKSIK